MPKKSKKRIKIVDYRSVNLAWLVDFKDRVFSKQLAPEIELVVVREAAGKGSQFEVNAGDTFCVTGETGSAYSVSRPYGDVRTSEIAKSAVSSKPREEWSTEDVAEYVIKRACIPDQCTYLELIAKPKQNVSKKEYKGTFVSQARRCRFADLVGSLEHFYTLKKAKIADQYVWLDIFSANQPKLTARNVEPAVRKENESQLTQGLHIAIANFEQRVMFMDKWDGATTLTRAWCVWEIFGVAKAKKPLEIALPESEYDRFIVTLTEEYDSIITKTSSVDVEKADCFNPVDLEAIHKAIRQESSFQELDDIIKTQLRLWVASTGKLQVEKEEQKAKPDLNKIRTVANGAGRTYIDQGDFANAEVLLRKALHVAEKISEDRKRDDVVATQLNNLAFVLRYQVGPFVQDMHDLLTRLRLNNVFKGDYVEAEKLQRESMRIIKNSVGDEHPTYARDLNNLAQLLVEQGKVNEARPLIEKSIEIQRKAYGNDHPSLATGLNSLATLLSEQGQFDDAEALYRQVVVILEKSVGKMHQNYASTLNNLGKLLHDQGKLEDAEPLMRESLKIVRKLHGDVHPQVATNISNLALLLSDQGKFDEAETLLRDALGVNEKVYGKEHPDYALSLGNLAYVLRNKGEYAEAEKLLREGMRIRKNTLGDQHPRYATDLNNLAELLGSQGRLDDAKPLYEEAVAIWKKVHGDEHPLIATGLTNIAGLLRKLGKADEAEPIFRQALEINRKLYGNEHPNVVVGVAQLASLLSAQGQSGEASAMFQQALDTGIASFGRVNADVAQIYLIWADSLKRAGNKSDARLKWEDACEIFKAAVGSTHPRYQRCVDWWED